jgi:serine/threonine protein kinase
VVVLKCIDKAHANEIEQLAYLHQTRRPNNHIIPFTKIISTQTDLIISMPYQTPLNECSTLSVPMVTDFGRQLLEAVQFMHGQGVVHRDLKPENVVVDLHKHQLFIIDYDLAMFVDGQRDEMVCGFVGTNGFTAPEVGDERYYSPIAADLWATGRVLGFLLSRSDDPKSPKLKLLQSISRRLLNDDPARRPGADKALNDILLRAKHPPFYKSSEQRRSSQAECWTPQPPHTPLTNVY